MAYLFPKYLMAGFVERQKQKLAFITYIDPIKKQICSAKSFNSWRTESMGIDTWENAPTSGFVINKNIKRDSHFGGNEYLRVWHPLGFEFEISIPVFERLISFVDTSKGEILTPCVLGWKGQKVELISTLDPFFEAITENLDYKKLDAKEDLAITNFTTHTLYDFKGAKVQCLGHGKVIDKNSIFYDQSNIVGKNVWFYNFTTHTCEQLKTRVKYLRHTDEIMTEDEKRELHDFVYNCFVEEDNYSMSNYFGVMSNPNKFYAQRFYHLMANHQGIDDIQEGDAYAIVASSWSSFGSMCDATYVTDGQQWYRNSYYGWETVDLDISGLRIKKRKKLI